MDELSAATDTGPAVDTAALLLELELAHRLVSRDVATVAPRGLGPVQARLLLAIEAEPGVRTIDLARQLHAAKSNVKAYLGQLEAGGLARRRWINRRHVALELTGRGHAALSALRDELEGMAVFYWGDLPAGDLEALGRVLAKLRERSQ